MRKVNMATVLTCIGAVGVVATAVMTANVTPKALKLIEKAEKEKGDILTVSEKVHVAAPAYIPAAVTGVATITCIFGANIMHKRTQASLASAYALLDTSYREYKRKVNELYGEEADEDVMQEIAKDRYSDYELEIPEGEALFFDSANLRYFRCRPEEVIEKAIIEDGSENGMECYIITVPELEY